MAILDIADTTVNNTESPVLVELIYLEIFTICLMMTNILEHSEA